MQINVNGQWQKARYTPVYHREISEEEWEIVRFILEREGRMAAFVPGKKWFTSPCDPLAQGCREYTIINEENTYWLKVPFQLYMEEKIRRIKEAKAAEIAAATGVPAELLKEGESCTATNARIAAERQQFT